MTNDKEIRKEAFLAGYTAARKSGFTTNKLGPKSERAAISVFERWYDLNVEENE
jgi:hypothetical protein